ncbi:HIT domain-containing protein [Tianweitania sediminis]|uniref:HIT domain-containing protein n=1 Tax=Tianweitania sediminis TaxID=1502156 RepID=A0A8J7QXB1_9HYPH|nr:HIT family protein [Tianweitania sediminis]MBP0438473.1 HIT domain-containing protein [Tianweitania sediminis]
MDTPRRSAAAFEIDARLEADSEHLAWLSLCELRLMNDSRWPWLILIPQRAGILEIHDLTPLDQTMLTFETNLVAESLKRITSCDKINTGALGNIVRQLHVHVIARTEGDSAWPGPVWGHGPREPYRREDLHQLAARVQAAL